MKKIGRRRFLGQASCAGIGSITFMNSLLNLKAIQSAAISNSSVYDNYNDYKAIVCILLAGGNDSYNMLVPYDNTSYQHYVTARSGLYNQGGLALGKPPTYTNGNLDTGSNLNAGHLTGYNVGGKEWAVHPQMTRVRDLFLNNRLAFLANTGTKLKKNTTKTHYQNNQYMPLGLFSHADQIQQWQTGIPNERSAKGWGGKMADLIGDCNANQNISMNVSLSGSNIFQTGNVTVEYAIDPFQGAVGLDGYDPNSMYLTELLRSQAVNSLIDQTHQDIFKSTYMDVVKNARDGFLEFDAALQNSYMFGANDFPDTYFGSALEMIARTISIRNALGFKRQVFFVTVGGWDHHDEVLNNQFGMLSMVSDALGSFQDAMAPSILNTENDVLTMFISEFGRTIKSNGNGSDHAWGGNTIVMGGPSLVNGGQIYGNYPSMDLDNNVDNLDGSGRFIPDLSTDEYFAEVAKWFGVPDTDLTMLFPNLEEFYTPSPTLPIGFLNI